MKGINIEVCYGVGVEVRSNVNLYFSGLMNIEGLLKFVRDCHKANSSSFRSFIVSVNTIDNRYNYVGYSRLKMESDYQGGYVLEYDVLGNKDSFNFREIFASKSNKKTLNECINQLCFDIQYLSEGFVEVS